VEVLPGQHRPAPVLRDGGERDTRQVLGGRGVVVQDADRAGAGGQALGRGAEVGEVEQVEPPRPRLGLGRRRLAVADGEVGGRVAQSTPGSVGGAEAVGAVAVI